MTSRGLDIAMVLVALSALSASCRATAQERIAEYRPALQEKRAAVLRAKTPLAKAKAYRALFKDRHDADLDSLKNDPDLGIALQAAWESSVLPVESKKDGFLTPLDPAPLRDFIQHSSKRIGVSIPAWWKESFFHCFARDGDNLLLFAGPASKEHASLHPNAPMQIRSPAGTSLKRVDQGIAISRNGKTVFLPDGSSETIRSRTMADFCQVDIGEDFAIAAFYRPWGTSYALVGLASKKGEVLWEKEVWASRWRDLVGGKGSHHQVTLLRVSEQIVLFGGDMYGMYIEVYDIQTGKNIYRFCTGYWRVLGNTP